MSKLFLASHSMTLTVEEKSTGIFDNITNESYHGEQLSYAYSRSDIVAGMDSMANIQQQRHGPKIETDAMEFGTLVHDRLQFWNDEIKDKKTGKSKFELMYAVAHKGTTKEDKEIKAAQCKQAYENGLTLIDAKDLELANNIRDAVLANPAASPFLKYKGDFENTIIWKDDCYFKAKPDLIMAEASQGYPKHTIVDFKTIASPSDGDLITAAYRAVRSRGYHIQTAMIIDGFTRIKKHAPGPFYNVFLEKGGRFRVLVCPVDPETIEEGRKIYREIGRQIAECERTKVWPGEVKLYDRWRAI